MHTVTRVIFYFLVVFATAGCSTLKDSLRDKVYPEAKADKAEISTLSAKITELNTQIADERQQRQKVDNDVSNRDGTLLVYINEAYKGTVKLDPFVTQDEGKRWLFLTGNEISSAGDLLKKFGAKPNPDEEKKAADRENGILQGKLSELQVQYDALKRDHDTQSSNYLSDKSNLEGQVKVTNEKLASANTAVSDLKLQLDKNKVDNQKILNDAINSTKNEIILDQAKKLNTFGAGFALLAGLCLIASVWVPFKAAVIGSGISAAIAAVLFAWAQFITDARYKWVIICVPVLLTVISVAYIAKKFLLAKDTSNKNDQLIDENNKLMSVAIVVFRRIKAMYDDGTPMDDLMKAHPEFKTLSDFTEGEIYNKLDMTPQQRADLVKVQWIDKQGRADSSSNKASTSVSQKSSASVGNAV
jgi:cell division protein FtsB